MHSYLHPPLQSCKLAKMHSSHTVFSLYASSAFEVGQNRFSTGKANTDYCYSMELEDKGK